MLHGVHSKNGGGRRGVAPGAHLFARRHAIDSPTETEGRCPQARSLEPCGGCCFWQERSSRVFEHPRTHFAQAPLLYTHHA